MTSVVNSGISMSSLMNGSINNVMNSGMSSVMNSGMYSGINTPASSGLPGVMSNSNLNSNLGVGMNNLGSVTASGGLGNTAMNQFGGIGMNRNMAVMPPMQKNRRQEEEDESSMYAFQLPGMLRPGTKEGRLSPTLSSLDPSVYGHLSGIGPQQRLGFPPISSSTNQFQPVISNNELGMRQRPTASQFQPFSNNQSLFQQLGNVDELGLQQPRSSQFQPVGSTAGHFQRSLTPNSMSSASLSVNMQQPNQLQQQSQQQQQQMSLHSPNRGMLSSRSLLAQFMNNTNNVMNPQAKRPVTSVAGSSLFQGSTSNLLQSSFNRVSQGGDNMVASLDLDFPSLGNRPTLQNSLPPNRNYVGMVNRPQPDPQEFQIHSEDFPALPGSQITASNYSFSKVLSVASSEANSKSSLDKSNQPQSKRGIQTHADGTISNIPPTMIADQFGIVGLLAFIRAVENDPNLVTLAHGIDLTTLGLNLTSQENIYSTFQSPWAENACRPQDIDYHVPAEYVTNIFIRDKLAPIKLNLYTDDLLFFLFYMNGGDVLQLTAAAELYRRDWRYHKEERIWITHIPEVEPTLKSNTYERGTYHVFDVQNWRKQTKELYLEYDKLEEKPQLPMSLSTAATSNFAPTNFPIAQH